MTPYHSDAWLTVYQGDTRAVMAQMPARSVHCVVTSPPYWGLRDYGTATWVGGDETCDHLPALSTRAEIEGRTTLHGGTDTVMAAERAARRFRDLCAKCGALRQDDQLGLEATPEEYVSHMVDVFRAIRHVLRDDGTVWLNLGDSYASGGGIGGQGRSGVMAGTKLDDRQGRGPLVDGLASKQLVGIPWRVAFALQADGWYLRSDVIWSKPNPMPESVTDRPTKSHEYVFMLTKSPRYYFDQESVREPSQPDPRDRMWGTTEVTSRHDHAHDAERGMMQYRRQSEGFIRMSNPAGRNLRSVWSIATQPYPGAHFATFPHRLVETPIKASTSERGVCADCGDPWLPIIERVEGKDWNAKKRADGRASGKRLDLVMGNGAGNEYDHARIASPPKKVGWARSCAHEGDPVPATVLDPFAGSGTTAVVAQQLSRRAVLIDLSLEYLAQALIRNRDIPLGLMPA